MKKMFVVLLSLFMMVFISCGDRKDSEKEKNGNEVAEQDDTKENDSDTAENGTDKDADKTELSDDDTDSTDSGDAETTDDAGQTDSGDAETADDADNTDTAADNDDPSDDSGDPQPDSDTDEDTGQDPDMEFTVNENLQPVPPEQNNNAGDTCDNDTFVEFCDGEVVVFCRESKVVRSSCGTDMVCITTVGLYDDYGNRNYADCYEKCDTAGDFTTCKQSRYYSDDGVKTLTMGTLKHDLCMKTSKGTLFFTDTNRNTEEICDSPCKDDTSCAGLKNHADQNNSTNAECNSDTFQEFCDGNNSVFCYDGRVTRINCSSTNTTCLTVSGIFDTNHDKNSSSCRNSCDEDESTSQTCSSVFIGSQSQYATTYDFCIPTSKGTLEFMILGEKCTSGCSSDGKTCR